MQESPRVSILMTNYNYGLYLEKSLNSVLSQTYKSYELIVVDDASTDNSREILKKYASEHSCINLCLHPQNKGVLESVKTALKEARGQYIYSFSSDDVILPNFLEENFQILDKYPEIGIICSDFAHFFSNSEEKIHTKPLCQINEPNFDYFIKPKNLIQLINKSRFWIPGNTVVVKKDLFLNQGGLKPEYGAFCDWYLFAKIGFTHGLYYLPKTLAAMRKHDISYSKTFALEKKENAWNELIKSLNKSKVPHLKKAFIKSHIFNSFGKDFYRYILKTPKHWFFFKNQVWQHFYKMAHREKVN